MAWLERSLITEPIRRLATVRTPYLIPAFTYPLWHLVAPASANDPWIFWWLIAGAFALVALLSRFVPFVERHQQRLFYLCSCLLTLQFFLLAFFNDMHPFYGMGSVMTVLATAIFIQQRRPLIAYSAFVVSLGAVLFALRMDSRMLAYWVGILPALALILNRLSVRANVERSLEEQVMERTAQLTATTERLRQEIEDKERLEEALHVSRKMEALGRMASGVAHEFNNLHTTISIYADLVLAELDESSVLRADVEQIRRTTRQAGALSDSLLAIGRPAGSATVVFDLNQLLREMRPVFERILGVDTRLAFELTPGSQPIRANRDAVEQGLLNLAFNARDAMPEGGTFSVSTVQIDRSRTAALGLPNSQRHEAHVLLAVGDTGIGMDAETRARIFDPFFTTKRTQRGTGLGLSIVYSMVEEAEGQIRVRSEPGAGARFELYLPISVEQPAESGYSARGHRRQQWGGGQILLVEDERELREAVTRVLSADGYQVTEAGDGLEALELTKAPDRNFDLVISDAVMPRMNGLELADELRARNPGTKVLLISGQLNHPSLRGREVPGDLHLLEKPFRLDELEAAVSEMLVDGPPAGG